MAIQIDEGIPLPGYPFDQLKEPGQSFFVPDKPAKKLASHVQAAQRKFGFHLKSKTRVEDGQMGTRIWLLEVGKA